MEHRSYNRVFKNSEEILRFWDFEILRFWGAPLKRILKFFAKLVLPWKQLYVVFSPKTQNNTPKGSKIVFQKRCSTFQNVQSNFLKTSTFFFLSTVFLAIFSRLIFWFFYPKNWLLDPNDLWNESKQHRNQAEFDQFSFQRFGHRFGRAKGAVSFLNILEIFFCTVFCTVFKFW